MSQKFCLKWNDFTSNVSQTFASSRKDEHLQDVTLVGNDNKTMKAHKLVLSASSNYFNEIFRAITSPNLVLCMEGIGSTEISHILDYIYHGEVALFQEELDRFLLTAKRLKIEGLLEETTFNYETEQKLAKKEEETAFPINQEVTTKFNDMIPEQYDVSNVEEAEEESLVSHNQREIDAKVNELINKLERGKYQCVKCGKITKRREHMVRHVETHIEGLSYSCRLCERVFSSRNSLQTHKYSSHH